MHTDEQFHRLAALAGCQHAVVSRRQAREYGLSREALRHRVARGQLHRVGPNVLRFPGAPVTPKQELMIAVLDAGQGAVSSHEASAALLGIPGFWPGPVDVSRQRRSQRGLPLLGELHEPTYLPPHHTTVVDGIPTTRIARTLFDLAGMPSIHPKRLERAINSVLTRSPGTLADLHTMLLELGGRGRPGISVMRTLLDGMPAGYVAPATGLEMDAIDLIEKAGFRIRKQVNLGSYEEWIGRVDVLIDDLPLVAEIDSLIHHVSPMDQLRDQARDVALEAAGFAVVRISDVDVYRTPWVVGPKVRRAADAVRRGEAVPRSGALAPLFSPSSVLGGLAQPLPGRRRYAS